MAVGLPKGPSYPRHSPLVFCYAAPWTTAEGQHTASLKSVACFLSLFSCLSLARLRLLILLLLMSGNVHPNPGPFFLCSVCAGNVTWRGKSLQCCTCFKWVHLRCSQLSLSKFRALDSSRSWCCPPPAVFPLVTLWLPPRTPTPIPPLYNLALHLLMLHSCPTLVFKLLVGSFCIFSLSPLTLSGSFNEMLEVFEPGVLNYYTFFHHILLTLSVSRNPILTHLPHSGFLDFLLCALIAPTLGLAFSLLMPCTLVAVSSFWSGRVYPSLNFLPPLFLHLIPTLIM